MLRYSHRPPTPLNEKRSTYEKVEECLESFGWEMDEPTEWDRKAQAMYPGSSFLHRFGRQETYLNTDVRAWLGF
jgi:hypothetical protein